MVSRFPSWNMWQEAPPITIFISGKARDGDALEPHHCTQTRYASRPTLSSCRKQNRYNTTYQKHGRHLFIHVPLVLLYRSRRKSVLQWKYKQFRFVDYRTWTMQSRWIQIPPGNKSGSNIPVPPINRFPDNDQMQSTYKQRNNGHNKLFVIAPENWKRKKSRGFELRLNDKSTRTYSLMLATLSSGQN